jgi:hypothetical protein
MGMRRLYWFLLADFLVGFVLFVLGVYFIYVVGDFQLGFNVAMVGAVLLGVLLAVAALFVARVYAKILRDAHEF